ncbi:chorismate mutase 2-like isoform X1 [Gossypium australe]|uniref:Chorismate mutase 2-like isoform X1 n=1 Tax=Gossypium australe TaxID=47621 RepID=A0A5B6W8T0_9ROSI|nr:chorismate mutase 2-like isoform X1 [Gossypium australe]
MIDSGVAWVDISGTLSFVNGRSGQVVTWHLMPFHGTDPYCASISDGFNRIEPPLFVGPEPAK